MIRKNNPTIDRPRGWRNTMSMSARVEVYEPLRSPPKRQSYTTSGMVIPNSELVEYYRKNTNYFDLREPRRSSRHNRQAQSTSSSDGRNETHYQDSSRNNQRCTPPDRPNEAGPRNAKSFRGQDQSDNDDGYTDYPIYKVCVCGAWYAGLNNTGCNDCKAENDRSQDNSSEHDENETDCTDEDTGDVSYEEEYDNENRDEENGNQGNAEEADPHGKEEEEFHSEEEEEFHSEEEEEFHSGEDYTDDDDADYDNEDYYEEN